MKIKIDRLKLLAYYLPSVPEDEFNMISWTHCAAGWSTQIPEFVNLGFTLHTNLTVMPVYETPRHRFYQNWEAVEKFFGLTEPEAKHLFSMYSYDDNATRATVVRRLKQFIANKVKGK